MTDQLGGEVAADAARPVPLKKNRPFVIWWLCQFLSNIGSSISVLAFPLLALRATHSAMAAGWVIGSEEAGLLVAGIAAGYIADRYNRAGLIAGTSALLAVLGVGFGAVTVHLSHPGLLPLIAYAVASGAVGAVQSSAGAGLLRTIVADDELEEAFALSNARSFIARTIGPPLGGALFALNGGLPFLVDGGSFLFVTVGALMLKKMFAASIRSTQRDASLMRSMTAGLRHIIHDRVLRVVTISIVATNVCFGGVVFLVILQLRSVGTSPTVIGTVSMASASGGLAGSLVTPRLVRRVPRTALLIISSAVLVVSLVIIAIGVSPVVIGAGFLLLMAVASPINAIISAVLMRATPEELVGRVSGSIGSIAQGVQWASPGIAGSMVAAWGSGHVIGGLAAMMGIAFLALIISISRGSAAYSTKTLTDQMAE